MRKKKTNTVNKNNEIKEMKSRKVKTHRSITLKIKDPFSSNKRNQNKLYFMRREAEFTHKTGLENAGHKEKKKYQNCICIRKQFQMYE